jgi:DNA replicative helicase MCM subunit Mcm2 (Cdc46/Mcm family)
MSAYFIGLTQEEKNTIKDKHRKPYDGYVTRGFNEPKEQILNVENLALDEKGVTVNNQGHVTEYKNTNINQKMKKQCNECGDLYEGDMCECSGMYEGETCEECGGEIREGETCECGTKGYTMEELEESIKVKSKASLVQEQINESLKWFKKIL